MLLLFSCSDDNEYQANKPVYDSINPVVSLLGNIIDTAYLHVPYKDQSINVGKYQGCLPKKNVSFNVKTDGYVDIHIPGNYTLTYQAIDSEGDTSAVLTRTVIVVPNPNGFFTGYYNVVCTTTAIPKGSSSPTITNTTYTAVISATNGKDDYKTSALKIGVDTIVADLHLDNGSISPGFFNVNYHWNSQGSGTLDKSLNSFTVHTNVFSWSPVINYKCTNVFTKQLAAAK